MKGCEEKMTSEKVQQYRKISSRFGIACSCFVMLVFVAYLGDTFLGYKMQPRWVPIASGIFYFGAVISAIACLLTAILSTGKPN